MSLQMGEATSTEQRISGDLTKFRLAKFRGIKKENFVLHLKETEFRYNTKNLGQNLYQILLKLIRENPVKFN